MPGGGSVVAARPGGGHGGDEAADVDHPVEDAEAERGVARVERLGDRALHRWLEEGRARADEERRAEHGAKGDGVRDGAADRGQDAEHDVAGDVEAEGDVEALFVAVGVGEAAGDHRQQALHEGPEHVDEALLAEGEAQAAAVGRHHVERQHGAHAEVGEPLQRLHDVGDPEVPAHALDLLGDGGGGGGVVFGRVGHRLLGLLQGDARALGRGAKKARGIQTGARNSRDTGEGRTRGAGALLNAWRGQTPEWTIHFCARSRGGRLPSEARALAVWLGRRVEEEGDADAGGPGEER